MAVGRRKVAPLWALALALACAQLSGHAQSGSSEPSFTYTDLLATPQASSGDLLRASTVASPPRTIPVVPAPDPKHNGRVCSTWGNFHYKAFDGAVFRFPGLCNYVFSAHCGAAYEDFNIQLRRGLQNGTAFPGRVTMKLQGLVVELTNTSVLVNSHPVQLPFSQSGVFMERSDDYLKVVAKLGLVFLWSQDGSLLLELDSKFANKTCGLCGDFNGNPTASEFLSHNTRLSPMEFGNLQKFDGPTEQCQDPAPEGRRNCSTSPGVCEELLNGPLFSGCTELVNVSSYIEACRQDLCLCASTDPQTCLCHTLAEYSRQCAHAGGLPQDWRGPDLCPRTCPHNMEHHECRSPCADTCSNPERSQVCEDHCVAGCFCPEGLVLDDIGQAGCVAVSQCSCTYNGATYAPGANYSTDCRECTCMGGRWSCEDVPCPGTCSVMGGAHFSTFDERQYTVHGDCSYVLAKSCNSSTFSVLAELRKCGLTDSETCLKSVTLSLGGGHMVVVIRASGEVFVNQIYTQLPVSAANVTIFRPSTFFIIAHTSLGLQLDVQLVPTMQVSVQLEPEFRGLTCGLCGNFNSVQADDFRTMSGVVEGTAAAFVNTFKTQASCPNVKSHFEDPCSLSVENEKFAQHWCSRLTDANGTFAECHTAVNPSTYHSNCLFDTCNCEKSEDCMCAALASYVHACAAKGVLLRDWRDGVCTKHVTACPKSMVYHYNIRACQPTCRSRNEPDLTCSINFVPVDGCACPEGTFLDDAGKCVEASSCPCYHSGSVVPNGESVHDGGAICTCTQGTLTCIGGRVPAPVCDAPMVFFDCRNATSGATGAGCQKSCHTLDMDCYSSQCVSGCVCPDGLVADGLGGCIAEEDCPCVHNEASYRPGETIWTGCNTCTCENRKWHCSDEPCLATCAVYGDGHYLTFDGRRYTFSGDCQYTLLQDQCGGNGSAQDAFRVVTENVPCGTTGTTCSKAIKIFLGSYELKLSDGKVEVEEKGKGQEAPYTIRQKGIFLVVDTDLGLVLLWDRKTTLFLRLSPEFKGRVCGLCGNFDDNAVNDFTTRSQSVVGNALEFGNSWKFSPSCPDAQAPRDACTANPYRKSWAQKQCSILNSATFAACHAHVEPGEYYEACVQDACACDSGGDCECFCTAVAAYAQACHEVGVCVSWRSPDICPLFCDFYNPEGHCEWHYQPCGVPCMRTCQNPNGECLHSVAGLEGCYPKCPSTAPIFDEDEMKCVSTCPPTPSVPRCHVHGKSYRPGATVPSDENCHSCVCTENGVRCSYDSKACVCTYSGRQYQPGSIIYDTTDGMGGCITARCEGNGTIHRTTSACSPTTAASSTPFSFSTAPPAVSSAPVLSTRRIPSGPVSTTMSKSPRTVPTTVPVTIPTACGEQCLWSPWLDVSRPGRGNDSGDYDTLDNLRAHGYRICQAPREVECRAEDAPGVPLSILGQRVQCSPDVGLSCHNREQASGQCRNYQIRVQCCSPRDCREPSPATQPTTSSTAQTGGSPASGITTRRTTVTAASTTTAPSTTHALSPSSRKNTARTTSSATSHTQETSAGTHEPTPSEPSRVSCVREICNWTQWIDGSYPEYGENGGDFDTFQNLRAKGYKFCKTPSNVQCRAAFFPNTPLDELEQVVTCNREIGLLCLNKDQLPPICYNYEIRIQCCDIVDDCRGETTVHTGTESSTATPTTRTRGMPSATQRLGTTNWRKNTTHSGTTSIIHTANTPMPTRTTTTGSRTTPTGTARSTSTTHTDTTSEPRSTHSPTSRTTTTSTGTASSTTVSHKDTTSVPRTTHTSTSGTKTTYIVTTSTTVSNTETTFHHRNTHITTSGTTTTSTGTARSTSVTPRETTSVLRSTHTSTSGTTTTSTGTTSSTTVSHTETTSAPRTTHTSTSGTITASTATTGTATMSHTEPTSVPRTIHTSTSGTTTTSTGTTSSTSVSHTETTSAPRTTHTSTAGTTTTSLPVTSSTHASTATSTHSQTTSSKCQPQCSWTKWFDVDFPTPGSHGGDRETYDNILSHGEKICQQPEHIRSVECRAESYHDVSIERLGQVVRCDPDVGLVCHNRDQEGAGGMCLNYEVRVLCCEMPQNCPPTSTPEPTTTSTTHRTSSVRTGTSPSMSHTETTSKPSTTHTTMSGTSMTSTGTARPTVSHTETTSKPSTTHTSTSGTTTTSTGTTSSTTVSHTETTSAPRTTHTSTSGTITASTATTGTATMSHTEPTSVPRTIHTSTSGTTTTSTGTTSSTSVSHTETTSAPRTTHTSTAGTTTTSLPVTSSSHAFTTATVSHTERTSKPSTFHTSGTSKTSTGTARSTSVTHTETTTVPRTIHTSTSGTTTTSTGTTSSTSVSHTETTSAPRTTHASTAGTTTTSLPVTSSTHASTATSTHSQTTSSKCQPQCSWTKWFDVDFPTPGSHGGDRETYDNILSHGEKICQQPEHIQSVECRAESYHDVSIERLGQVVRCDPDVGLVCHNRDQEGAGGMCLNYEVRVLCCEMPQNCPPTSTPEPTTTSTTHRTSSVRTGISPSMSHTETTSKPSTTHTTMSGTSMTSTGTARPTVSHTETTSKPSTTHTSTSGTTTTSTGTTSSTTVSHTETTSAPRTTHTSTSGTITASTATTGTATMSHTEPTSVPRTIHTSTSGTTTTSTGTMSSTSVSHTETTSAPRTTHTSTSGTTTTSVPVTSSSHAFTTATVSHTERTSKPSTFHTSGTSKTSTGTARSTSVTHTETTTVPRTIHTSTSGTTTTSTGTTSSTSVSHTETTSAPRTTHASTAGTTTTSLPVTSSTHASTATSTHSQTTSSKCQPQCSWTKWFDVDFPTPGSHGGDRETYDNILSHGEKICQQPEHIRSVECRAESYHDVSIERLGQVVRCDPDVGLVCHNRDQEGAGGMCLNYEVRVLCCEMPQNCPPTSTPEPTTTSTTHRTSSVRTGTSPSMSHTETTSKPSTTHTSTSGTTTTSTGTTSSTTVSHTETTSAPTATHTSTSGTITASTATTGTATMSHTEPTSVPRTIHTSTSGTTTTSTGTTSSTSVSHTETTSVPRTTHTSTAGTTTTSLPVTSSTHASTATSTHSQTTSSKCQPQCSWTKWFDVDFPTPGSHGGDRETYDNILSHGEKICQQPEHIRSVECRAESYHDVSIERLGQVVRCDPDVGLVCHNRDQEGAGGMCLNYEVRVLCCEMPQNCPPTSTPEPTTTSTTHRTSSVRTGTSPSMSHTETTSKPSTTHTTMSGTSMTSTGTARPTVSHTETTSKPSTTHTSTSGTTTTSTGTTSSTTVSHTETTSAPRTTHTSTSGTITASTATTGTATMSHTEPTSVPRTIHTSTSGTTTTSTGTMSSTSVSHTETTSAPRTTHTSTSGTTTTSVPVTSSSHAFTTATVSHTERTSKPSTFHTSGTSKTSTGTARSTSVTHTETTTVPRTIHTSTSGTTTTSTGTTSSTSVSHTETTSAPRTTHTSTAGTTTTSLPVTSSTHASTATSTHSQTTSSKCQPQCSWTKWFDVDFPTPGSHGGDRETYDNILSHGEKICQRPEHIRSVECRAESYHDVSIERLGQVVHCDPDVGLVCHNRDQEGAGGMCLNYEVRVLCCEMPQNCPPTSTPEPTTTSTTHRTSSVRTGTSPSMSHTETTSKPSTTHTSTSGTTTTSTGTTSSTTVSHTETTSAPTATHTSTSGTITASTATTGTATMSHTEPTSVPRTIHTSTSGTTTTSTGTTSSTSVSHTETTSAPRTTHTSTAGTTTTSLPVTSSTHASTATSTHSQTTSSKCQPQCSWTKWFDVDFPTPGSHGGDRETYDNILSHGEKICQQPEHIRSVECRAESYHDVSIERLGQVVRCDPDVGLVCHNRDQEGAGGMCLNYEVRVLCCEMPQNCPPTSTPEPTTTSTTHRTSSVRTGISPSMSHTETTSKPSTTHTTMSGTSMTSTGTARPTVSHTETTSKPSTTHTSTSGTTTTSTGTTSSTTVSHTETTSAPRTTHTSTSGTITASTATTGTATMSHTEPTSVPRTIHTSTSGTTTTSTGTTSSTSVSHTETTSAPRTTHTSTAGTTTTSLPVTSSTHASTATSTHSQTTSSKCQPQCSWTKWFDVDFPTPGSHGGDRETYDNILSHGEKICQRPEHIRSVECRAESYHDVSIERLGQVVRCDPDVGLVCHNRDQEGAGGMCLNYEVRVLCCEMPQNCPPTSTPEPTTTSTTHRTSSVRTGISPSMSHTETTSKPSTTHTSTSGTTTTSTGTTSSTTVSHTETTSAPTATHTSTSGTITASTATTGTATMSHTEPTSVPRTIHTSTSGTTTTSTGTMSSTSVSHTETTSAPRTTHTSTAGTTTTSLPVTSSTHASTATSTHSQTTSSKCQPQCSWTKWFDVDFPTPGSHGGDRETYDNILSHGEKICQRPEHIVQLECRAESYHDVSIEQLGQVVQCDPDVGLVCHNRDQKGAGGMCLNYQVRVLCCEMPQNCPSETPAVTFAPTPWTSTPASGPGCFCHVSGHLYPAGSVIYSHKDLDGHCYSAYCSRDCQVDRTVDQQCPPTTSPATATVSSSTPTSEPSPGCHNTIPPRKKGEIWQMPNCSQAKCNGHNSVSVYPRQCPDVAEPTCANGYPPLRVPNDDGCCYHYQCQCVCSGWGDPHYLTFDGTYYTFLDNCTYVLMQQITPVFGHLRVLVDNFYCDDAGSAFSCPRSVTLEYQDARVVLTRRPVNGVMTNQVIFNGQVVSPSFQQDGIVITRVGIKMYATIPKLGVQVMFTGLIFSVRVPYSTFANNTEGQCGTCTNNKEDECRLPGGKVNATCSSMAHHWRVPDQSCPVPPVTPTVASTTAPPCPKSPICELLFTRVFESCHSTIPPMPFYEGCVFDHCHVSQPDVVCSSLELYASLCASYDICVDWRSQTNGTCPFTCPADKVYQACGPVNPPYCYGNDSAILLTLPEAGPITEGCFCPESLTLFSTDLELCVPSDCSRCLSPSGEPMEPGDTITNGCHECTCDSSSLSLSCQPVSCPSAPLCKQPGFVAMPMAAEPGTCCPAYNCSCDPSYCPEPMDCPAGSLRMQNYEDPSCCPSYWCRWHSCSINGTLYEPSSLVPSAPCKTCRCELSQGPGEFSTFWVNCEEPKCPTECLLGFEYRKPEGQCCGECVQVYCTVSVNNSSTLLYHPGESWTDPKDACVSYQCEQQLDKLVVVTIKESCPPLSCPDDQALLSKDGCCHYCPPPPSQNMSTCTLHHEHQVIQHEGCNSSEPVRLAYCRGNCGDSSSKYSLAASTVEHQCSCCQELRTSPRTVTLHCADGASRNFTYTEVEECGCHSQQCPSPADSSHLDSSGSAQWSLRPGH